MRMMIVRNANFSGHTRRQTLCLVAASGLQPTNNGIRHQGGLLPPFTFNHTNRSLSPSSSTQLFVTTNPDHTLPRTTQNQESSPISPGRPPEHRVSLSLMLLLLLDDDDDNDDGSPEKTRFTNHFPTTVSSSYGNFPHLGARASPANTHPKIRAFACAELTGLQRQRMSCVATTLQTREHFRKRDAKRVPRGLEKLLRFLA